MLRGYCKYLLQTGVPILPGYVEGTFARYPLLARLLWSSCSKPASIRHRPTKARTTSPPASQLKAHFDVLAAGDEGHPEGAQDRGRRPQG